MTTPGTNPDWPLGPALRAQREAAGLSIRAAARDASISEGKWRQLETGYLHAGRGHKVPTGTTPQTVAAAARAVRWSVAEALEIAGYNPGSFRHLDPAESAPDERVPGFAQLTAAQRTAIVDLVASILAARDEPATPPRARAGAWPVRAGEPPDDLLDSDDVRLFRGQPSTTAPEPRRDDVTPTNR